MSKKLLPLVACLLFAALLSAQKNYEFRNGRWFNGKDFVQATWYTSGGMLSRKAPAKIDSIVDLDGRWVVPPMADASCSSVVDNPTPGQQAKMYMDEGVFYLQVLRNTQAGRTAAQKELNRPTAPDASYANGPITCTLGFPFVELEGPANNMRNPQQWAQRYDLLKMQRKMLGDGYWFIDSKEALDRNWDKIKAQKPGVISIYLLDAEKSGGKEGKGLTPDVAKAVVKKAHKSDLRVYAHVENADDVRLGLKIGVDGFANLPGTDWDGTGDTKKFDLNDDDIKKLAKKQTAIVPLFSHAQSAKPRPNVLEWQKKTLGRLLDGGANVVLGSDDIQRTIRNEVNYWFQLSNLDARQMMHVLCEATPRAVFPDRKIGKLDNGYEANFLVLSDDPLTNVLKLRAIAFKVKNGVLIK